MEAHVNRVSAEGCSIEAISEVGTWPNETVPRS
jgi:hypothetical protein